LIRVCPWIQPCYLLFTLFIKRYNSIFTFLWHNSSFDPVGWQGWKEVCERVIEYISDQDAWVTTGKEIIANFVRR
jgi:hypothetical protein